MKIILPSYLYDMSSPRKAMHKIFSPCDESREEKSSFPLTGHGNPPDSALGRESGSLSLPGGEKKKEKTDSLLQIFVNRY